MTTELHRASPTETAAMQFPSRPVQMQAAMPCYTICCHWQQHSTAHKQM